MQILPPKELSGVIKHYLFLESSQVTAGKIRLFADDNTGIVFSLASLLLSGNENPVPVYLPASFLYGQVNTYHDIFIEKPLAAIIVVLQPAGAMQLTGIAAHELSERIIATSAIFGHKAAQLQDQLSAATDTGTQLVVLNTFFLSLVAAKAAPQKILIDASLQYIINKKGLVSISQLAKFTGYTERHIHREFTEHIGMGPKAFCNVIKLHSFLRLLKTTPATKNLAGLAYGAGYADQSHLIKAFRKTTGMTPSDYINRSYKLAVNFVVPYA